jgi:hypothetical protein
VGRDPTVGRQALSLGSPASPAKKFFTQQRVATIEFVVHWVAKNPEKFKWISSQKSLGTTDIADTLKTRRELREYRVRNINDALKTDAELSFHDNISSLRETNAEKGFMPLFVIFEIAECNYERCYKAEGLSFKIVSSLNTCVMDYIIN